MAEPSQERYSALRILVIVFWVVAVLSVGVGLFVSLWMASKGADWFPAPLLGGVVAGFFYLLIAEAIQLALGIEKNTRLSAESLQWIAERWAQESKQRAGGPSTSQDSDG